MAMRQSLRAARTTNAGRLGRDQRAASGTVMAIWSGERHLSRPLRRSATPPYLPQSLRTAAQRRLYRIAGGL